MKKILSLTIILLTNIYIVKAQTVIDEDFLDVITANATPLWNESAAQFASNIVPEKYKDESAVVFGFKRELSIDKQSKAGFLRKGERSLIFFENVRFKIKLNDRNAVKSFTEFYFRYSDKLDGFAAKVIKKEGTITNVSLANAVRVESVKDVPEFFKSFFDQEVNVANRYFKVAIPDLLPGDILEYVAITKSKLDVRDNGYIEFSPQYEQCAKKYPVLFNQISIETDEKSYFKAMSKNGAPSFKKETSNNADFIKYVFSDNDRPTEKDVNFVNYYRQSPFVKFQVTYSNKENVKGALMGNNGEIKSSFTKQELSKAAWEDFEKAQANAGGLAAGMWAELKKLDAKEMTDKEYIKTAYYRIRNYVVFRDNYLNDEFAAALLANLLSYKKISYDVIISVSNNIGTLNEVLFEEEIRYAIRIGNDYYFNCTDYSNPNELVESLLGSEAYVIEAPNKKTGEQNITVITLPDATFTDNTSKFVLDVSLAADMNTLAIARTTTYQGIPKNRNISTALKYIPYMFQDFRNYGGYPPTEGMKAKQEEQYDDQVATIKKQYKEAKPELVKKELQSEFGKKVVYKDFVVSSEGRSLKSQQLVFTETFELPNMVRKAGKKLLLNIVGLVGSQLQFRKEERTRKNDIDVSYARELNWVINFTVPNGYTIEGLTELNNTVENDIGIYACKGNLTGNIAKIEIRKVYKKATFSKTKWNEMLNFVDAAYNTSFKNILLKPNN